VMLPFSQSPARARVNWSTVLYSGQRRCDTSAGQSLHNAAVTRQPLAVPMMSESSRHRMCYVQTSSVDCVQTPTCDTINGTVCFISGAGGRIIL
jgi:hypothetical protein